MIQFYAPLTGYASFATVARGLIEEINKSIPVCAYDIDPAKRYDGITCTRGGIIEAAPVALYVGPILQSPAYLAKHKIKIGCFVCEADKLPAGMVEVCNSLDLICVPSLWCKSVFIKSGVQREILIVSHGVHEAYRPIGNPGEIFTLLHLCSSVKYPERKGTPQLIEAFQKLNLASKSIQLTIRTVGYPTEDWEQRILVGKVRGVALESTATDRPSIHARRYNQVHAIVQPSRAEGFGIVPLEARACGVPVLYNAATGFGMHFPIEKPASVGVVGVRVGDLEFSWGDEEGLAPGLNSDDVAMALQELLLNYRILRQNALKNSEVVRKEWAWSKVTSIFREKLKEIIK